MVTVIATLILGVSYAWCGLRASEAIEGKMEGELGHLATKQADAMHAGGSRLDYETPRFWTMRQ